MSNVKFEELEVLLEPRVDLYDLAAANEFDFRENFVHMGWMEYFSKEKKPIYTELVKEFWMHARVHNGNIYGCVQGKEVVISLQLLPYAINGYGEGVKFSDGWDEDEIKDELQGIIFEKPNGKSYSDLNPEYKVLYKIIYGCILPIRNSAKIVPRSYRFIMWHFAKKISINLPEMIFDFLKRAVCFSRSGKVKTIPLGRVISGCLETFGIIDSLQRSKDLSIVRALKPSFGLLFNQITLARLKVRSCDVVKRLLKQDKEAETREASAKPIRKELKVRKSVASDSTQRVTRRRAIDELTPIDTTPLLSVIFPEDNEEVILEYRKIVAEDLLRANPNYIPPTVQYEDYYEDNKDEVRKYMKKIEEEKVQETAAITAPDSPPPPSESKKRSAPSSNQVLSKKTKTLDAVANKYESTSSTIPKPSEPEHIVRYEDYYEDNKDEVKKYMKKIEEEKAQETTAITAPASPPPPPESKKRSAPSINQVPSKKTKTLDAIANVYESSSSTIPQPSEPLQIVRTKLHQPTTIEPQINQSLPLYASASNNRKEFPKSEELVAPSSSILKEPLESDHPATSRSSDVVTREELSKIVQKQQELIAFMATTNQRHEDIAYAINNLTSLVQKILVKP